VARLLLLGPAREAARVRKDEFDAATVAEVLDLAVARYGTDFAKVLATSQVWVNGDVANFDDPLTATDEVVVLPPISGG
jgi:molybdopterin synthase sulfur carrier subunit